MSLDEFEELVDRTLPEDGYETVGGFVISQLDKIPSAGDTVRYEDMAFTVLGTKGRRITKLRVERGLPPAQPDDEDEESSSASGSDTPLALPAPDNSPNSSANTSGNTSAANQPAPQSRPRQ